MHLFKDVFTPQTIAIALISALLLGGMITVDSVAIMKYPEFFKNNDTDLVVYVSRYKTHFTTPTIDEERMNLVLETLGQSSFVKNMVTFYKLYDSHLKIANITYNLDSVIGMKQNIFSSLNISLTRGALHNNSVALREDIFDALHLKFGDYLNFSFHLSNTTTSFLLLPITATFEVNNTYLNPEIQAIVTVETFQNLVLRIHPYSVSGVIVVDMNEAKVDPVNPENSYDTLSGLSNTLSSFSANHTVITVHFYLLGKLARFIEWKNTFRINIFFGLLPIIIVFWFVQYYLVELFFAEHKRELDVMIARGINPSIKNQLFIKHLAKATLYGFLLGLILGYPVSIIYLASSSNFLSFNINVYTLQSASYIISLYSLVFSFGYIFLIVSVGYLIYNIVKFYSLTISKLIETQKGLIKKILMIVGGSYIDIALLVYSLLIFLFIFLNIDSLSQANLMYNQSFYVLLYASPFAFIIGSTRFIFRFLNYVSSTLTRITKKRRFLSLYLGIKNLTRRDSYSPVIGMIFALIIALSQTSAVVAQTYTPSIYAHEHWVYGTDFLLQFTMDSPNVTLAREIESQLCTNISGIESHTMMLVAYKDLYKTPTRFVGVNPKTFSETIFTEQGNLIHDTSYSNIISRLENTTNGIVFTDFLSSLLDLQEGTTINLFSLKTGTFTFIRVVGVIDMPLSRILLGDHSGLPLDGGQYSVSQLREYFYGLTTYNVIEELNESVVVSIGIRTTHFGNANATYYTLMKRINTLRHRYIDLQSASLKSGQFEAESILNDYQIQILHAMLNVNFMAALVIILLVLWDVGILLKKKRSRELAVFIALGETRTRITFALLFELIAILLYGAIIGLFTSYPFSIIVGKSAGEFLLYVLSFLFTENFIWIAFYNVLYALLFTIALGYLILYFTLRIDLSKLLKLEWSSEKLVEEVEVVF